MFNRVFLALVLTWIMFTIIIPFAHSFEIDAEDSQGSMPHSVALNMERFIRENGRTPAGLDELSRVFGVRKTAMHLVDEHTFVDLEAPYEPVLHVHPDGKVSLYD